MRMAARALPLQVLLRGSSHPVDPSMVGAGGPSVARVAWGPVAPAIWTELVAQTVSAWAAVARSLSRRTIFSASASAVEAGGLVMPPSGMGGPDTPKDKR